MIGSWNKQLVTDFLTSWHLPCIRVYCNLASKFPDFAVVCLRLSSLTCKFFWVWNIWKFQSSSGGGEHKGIYVLICMWLGSSMRRKESIWIFNLFCMWLGASMRECIYRYLITASAWTKILNGSYMDMIGYGSSPSFYCVIQWLPRNLCVAKHQPHCPSLWCSGWRVSGMAYQ